MDLSPGLFWVLGAGGLLGSHLLKQVPLLCPSATVWTCVVPRFSWSQRAALQGELVQAVTAFRQAVAVGGYRFWTILWAAGQGSIASPAEALRSDRELWEFFLSILHTHLPERAGSSGTLLFASSAGAVYGDSPDDPITEASPCSPTSDYGRAKLWQEDQARAFARRRGDLSLLIGRISTLYGPGQNLKKPQGLIAHLSRGLIYRRPVHLYVPLDNIRDYLFVTDCARALMRGLLALRRRSLECGRPQQVLKLFASEQVTSIAQVLRIFKQIARRQPQIVCVQSPLGLQHPRRMSFRSRVLCVETGENVPATSLSIGISRTHQHQLDLFQQGLLC